MARAVESLTTPGLRRRLSDINRQLASQGSSPDTELLQSYFEARAELRRRLREGDGVSDELAKEIRSDAKADAVLWRLTMARTPVDPSVLIFDGVDTQPSDDPKRRVPTFSVQEVAKAFFGRSSHWIRWQEREGTLVKADGQPIGGRTPTYSRYYTLSDVEEMAHALYRRSLIDEGQLILALTNARNVALMTGVITLPEEG